MTPLFRVEMLPARQGDCLWIEWGDTRHPYRALIDAGTPGTYTQIRKRLRALPAAARAFELLIVTHIDNDHIGGALKLLGEAEGGVSFGDVWFNGWRHLPGSGLEEFGPVQGEKLTTQLVKPGARWNLSFGGHAVVLGDVGTATPLPLAGGMQVTLLSPGAAQLAALRPVWEEECRKAGLNPARRRPAPPRVPAGFEAFGPPNVEALAASPFEGDDSQANGSSIAVLAEFDGRRILLAGDAHPDVLLDGIDRLLASRREERLRLEVFKLPHHGSKANVSRDLLAKVECRRYLFSTDGTQFKHPDKEAVARVIKFGGPQPELLFNYQTQFNSVWENRSLKRRYGYSLAFPGAGRTGLGLEL